jgi:flagellar operon protein
MKEVNFDPTKYTIPQAGASPGVARTQPTHNREHAVADFKILLAEEMLKSHGVTLSKHAIKRLAQHAIDLSSLVRGIAEGFQLAEKKGCRSTLMLANDLAILCSVPERTVVTVKRVESLQDRIFTNIDSTILLEKKGGSVLP